VNYNVALNFTYAKNQIDFWDETPNIPEYQKSTGKQVDARLYYQADGVFNTQQELDSYPHWAGATLGDIKFVDYNGDGVINGDDRVRSNKSSVPPFVFGLTLGANWHNFDIMALLQGATGAQTYFWRERAGTAGNFYKWTYDHHWTPENSSVEYARINEREDQYWARDDNASQSSTYFLRNTDYLRLKNLEIGYTFNFQGLRNAGIQNLRIYVNGTNLLTIDKIKIQDPEASNNGKEYPQRRVLNFGASITF
jgi:hypothetical protein